MKNEKDYFSIRKSDFIDKKMLKPIILDSCIENNQWFMAIIQLSTESEIRVCLTASESGTDIQPDWNISFQTTGYFLLTNLIGRFLWIKIQSQTDMWDTHIKIYPYPYTFTRYLPEVFQERDYSNFFLRFVAVFQTAYIDMEKRIEKIKEMLNPAVSDDTYIRILAKWLKCDEISYLQGENAKKLLNCCTKLYKKSGTKEAINKIIALLAPNVCSFIIEYFQIHKYLSIQTIKLHYSANPYFFTIILWDNLISKETLKIMKVLVEGFKPSHCNFQIVSLENRIRLDVFTYLGMNSMLSSYETPMLDESHYLTQVIV